VAGFCEHGNEPSGFIKKAGYFLTSCVTISFSTNILHHRVRNTELLVLVDLVASSTLM
jgi:hypothetical protein